MRAELRPSVLVADLAGAQHGVLGYMQLREAGLSATAIDGWTRTGRLHRVHRGVFAVGHRALSRRGRCLAAVLAGGDGAVLSHCSAAWLWGLRRTLVGPVEISVPSRGHGQPRIRVHRTPALSGADRAEQDRIPVTTVPRTLLDLALTEPRRRLEDAVERAERVGLLDLIEIDAMLRRRKGAPGTRRLREALELYRTAVFSRARTELLFLRLIRHADLRPPSINFFVEGCELDAYWERERFGVELDGWESHGTRRAFEEDRLRQEELKLAGIDSIRVSARRIEREPERVAANLRRLLAQRRKELYR